jgi:hypothetical protein
MIMNIIGTQSSENILKIEVENSVAQGIWSEGNGNVS